MEVRGQIQALSTSAAGKEPLESVKHEVGWAPDPVWTFWRTENSFATAGLIHHSDPPIGIFIKSTLSPLALTCWETNHGLSSL